MPNLKGPDTDAAIAAAAEAFQSWAARPGKERAEILRRWALFGGHAGGHFWSPTQAGCSSMPMLHGSRRPLALQCTAGWRAVSRLAGVDACALATKQVRLCGARCSDTCLDGEPAPPNRLLSPSTPRWYDEARAARDDITTLMTLEAGKPLPESRAEFDLGYAPRCSVGAGQLAYGKGWRPCTCMRSATTCALPHQPLPLPLPVLSVESIAWFAEEARRVNGDVLASPTRHNRFLVFKQPVGVVGAITPW